MAQTVAALVRKTDSNLTLLRSLQGPAPRHYNRGRTPGRTPGTYPEVYPEVYPILRTATTLWKNAGANIRPTSPTLGRQESRAG